MNITREGELFSIAKKLGYTPLLSEEVTNNNSTLKFVELNLIKKWIQKEYKWFVGNIPDMATIYKPNYEVEKTKWAYFYHSMEDISQMTRSGFTYNTPEEALEEGIYQLLNKIEEEK